MKQELLDKLKSSLPVGLNITGSMDYPHGMQTEGVFSTGEPVAKITGILGPYGIVITWFYESPEDKVEVDYLSLNDGDTYSTSLSELKGFLLSLKK